MANHSQEPTGNEQLPAVIESSDQANRFSIGAIIRWMKKHPKATAGGLIGTATAAVAGGVFAANVARGPVDAGPTPVDTPTAEPTEPTVTPTPTETEAPVNPSEAYNYGITKSEVDALIAPGQEALLAQPIEVRMNVGLYYAQEELVEYADLFHRITKDPNDILPAGGMSAESSVEDVRTYLFYMHDIATTRAQPDGYHIDAVTGKAINAGLYLNGAQSVGYINSNQFIDAFAAQQETADAESVSSARSLAAGGRRAPEIVEGSVTSGKDDQNRPFYTFTVITTRPDGTTSEGSQITARWIVSSTGVGGWVQD